MPDCHVVAWSKRVDKRIAELPDPVARKLYAWAAAVRDHGLRMTRRIPGLHDEPLQGQRFGQRSVRLNRSWRVIYVMKNAQNEQLVEVLE